MLGSDASSLSGREARVARTAKDRTIKNALSLPQGSIIVIDELGRPLKQLPVTVAINDHPAKSATTDDHGRIYPLAAEIDDVTITFDDSHETASGDSSSTPSGQHFELGGAGPRASGSGTTS